MPNGLPQPTDPPAPPRPMVGMALALMAGMALGLAFPWPWWVWGWLAVLPVTAALAFLLRSRRIHGPQPPAGGLVPVAMLGIGCLLGSGLELADRQAWGRVPEWAEGQLVRAEGTLDAEPREMLGGVELVLRDATLSALRVGGEAGALPGRLAVAVHGEAAERLLDPSLRALPLPGQRVGVWGRFRRTDGAQTTPSTYDARRYWRGRGVFGRISMNAPGDLEFGPLPTGPVSSMWSAFRSARGWMAANLAAHLQGDPLALARALLLGEFGLLTPDNREAFNHVGLAHLLSVSGLHTGFVLLFVIGLARLCWLSPRACAWIGIVSLILYAGLTGFRPPVVRASTMGVFLLLGFALGRFVTPLASLATAAWATLLADPRNLLRLDWQLSYACALSIILLAPALHEWIVPSGDAPIRRERPLPRWRRWINRNVLLASAVIIAVQLGLAPLQIAYFQRLNPAAFLANLLAVPLTMVTVFGALLLSAAGKVAIFGAALGMATDATLRLLTLLVGWCERLPWIAVEMQPWPGWFIAVYYGFLLGGPGLLTGRGRFLRLDRLQRRSLAVCLGACLALLFGSRLVTPVASGRLDFYVLDVGQGDGLVVRFPNGRVMVIDAGHPDPADQGRLTVAPFLRRMGIGRIDCLVATHADADHIGGLPHLIDQFPVGEVVLGSDINISAVYRGLIDDLARRKIPVIAARAGERLAGFGEVKVELLGSLAGRNDNNASVAILFDIREVQILAVGDLETAGENQLLREGRLRDIEVLKVGHHGSRSSTSEMFLAAVRPEIALVSVGRANRFGHPAPEVLERLIRHGALVCRTDEYGTLWVRTDGRRLETLAYIGPE